MYLFIYIKRTWSLPELAIHDWLSTSSRYVITPSKKTLKSMKKKHCFQSGSSVC